MACGWATVRTYVTRILAALGLTSRRSLVSQAGAGTPMEVVYYHGGPGLNSRADEPYIERLFAGVATKVHLWDEPSQLRGDQRVAAAEDPFNEYLRLAIGYFDEVTASGDGVVLVAHSFGANIAIRLAQANPRSIRAIVLLAPALDFRCCLGNIGACAVEDFGALGRQSEANELATDLKRLGGEWSSVAGGVCERVLSDERLLSHYWFDPSVGTEYLARLEGRHAIDAESFAGVTPRWKPVPLVEVNVRTLVLDGDSDKIVSREVEAPTLQRIFPTLECVLVPDCGHFVHVERTDAVRERVVAFLATVALRPSA